MPYASDSQSIRMAVSTLTQSAQSSFDFRNLNPYVTSCLRRLTVPGWHHLRQIANLSGTPVNAAATPATAVAGFADSATRSNLFRGLETLPLQELTIEIPLLFTGVVDLVGLTPQTLQTVFIACPAQSGEWRLRVSVGVTVHATSSRGMGPLGGVEQCNAEGEVVSRVPLAKNRPIGPVPLPLGVQRQVQQIALQQEAEAGVTAMLSGFRTPSANDLAIAREVMACVSHAQLDLRTLSDEASERVLQWSPHIWGWLGTACNLKGDGPPAERVVHLSPLMVAGAQNPGIASELELGMAELEALSPIRRGANPS